MSATALFMSVCQEKVNVDLYSLQGLNIISLKNVSFFASQQQPSLYSVTEVQ